MNNQTRTVMDLAGAPWSNAIAGRVGGPMKGSKRLTAPDGHSVGLIHMDGLHAAHFHTRNSTLFILQGSIELRGRVFGPRHWVLEPAGAIHAETRSHDVIYGLGMSDGDFGVGNVRLEHPDEIPEWVHKMGVEITYRADGVDAAALPYEVLGSGLGMKVLHVFDGRPAFAALVRAEAGATLPARRYLGPADMYVLSGRMEFADGAVAPEGSWVHEAAGAEDGIVRFPVETEFLANTYGAILEFDGGGALTRALEGYSIRETLAASRLQHA